MGRVNIWKPNRRQTAKVSHAGEGTTTYRNMKFLETKPNFYSIKFGGLVGLATCGADVPDLPAKVRYLVKERGPVRIRLTGYSVPIREIKRRPQTEWLVATFTCFRS